METTSLSLCDSSFLQSTKRIFFTVFAKLTNEKSAESFAFRFNFNQNESQDGQFLFIEIFHTIIKKLFILIITGLIGNLIGSRKIFTSLVYKSQFFHHSRSSRRSIHHVYPTSLIRFSDYLNLRSLMCPFHYDRQPTATLKLIRPNTTRWSEKLKTMLKGERAEKNFVWQKPGGKITTTTNAALRFKSKNSFICGWILFRYNNHPSGVWSYKSSLVTHRVTGPSCFLRQTFVQPSFNVNRLS